MDAQETIAVDKQTLEAMGDRLQRIVVDADARVANFCAATVDRSMVAKKQERTRLRDKGFMLAKTALTVARFLPQDCGTKMYTVSDLTTLAKEIRASAPPAVPGFESAKEAIDDAAFEKIIDEAICLACLRQ